MKLIIDNRTDLSMQDVLQYCSAIVSTGEIREIMHEKQYCFITGFQKKDIYVSTVRNKKSYRLVAHYNKSSVK